MKEDFIHFLWKYRLFNSWELFTTKGLRVEILSSGTANQDAGPDFSAARVRIDDTLWVGNIEIHTSSSDWYRHGHQNDDAYNSIILHVVMQHDREVTDSSGNEIPVLEVRKYFDMALYYKYEKIINSKSWLACGSFLGNADNFMVVNWLSRLQVERLENKSNEIQQFFNYFGNSWEQTFYFFLARNFGFKINSGPFALLAQVTPYKILARHKDDLTLLEALLFGQAGMLSENFADAYPALLKREYSFLQKKYSLTPIDGSLWKFARLRPSNFPSLRIAQFAGLIHRSSHLFSKITGNSKAEELISLFEVRCSPYWNNHYRFDKPSAAKDKNLGSSAIENIIINTIVPLKFVYGSESLRTEIRDQSLDLLMQLPSEQNSIIRQWEEAGIKAQNAGESQALIELRKYYCTPRKCLHCAIGHSIVRAI